MAWAHRAIRKKHSSLVQQKMLKAFENEGIIFDDILIDRSFAADNAPTRKPGPGYA